MKNLIQTLEFLEDCGEHFILNEKPLNLLAKTNLNDVVELPLLDLENLKIKLSKDAARKQAEELAYNSNTLEDLKAAMNSFEGCALKKTAMNMVFSDGNPKSHIMFLGEAPGADEDRLGKPFVGQSGQLLDKFLAYAGFSREKNIYITNTIAWRPPGNRQPTPEESYMCMPFVERHIELKKPKFLVMLGGTALKALHNPKEGIVKLRGKWIPYKTSVNGFEVETIPFFHPAFLLRSPGQKKMFWRDVLTLKRSFEREEMRFG